MNINPVKIALKELRPQMEVNRKIDVPSRDVPVRWGGKWISPSHPSYLIIKKMILDKYKR